MYHPEGILCPTLRFGRSFYPSPKGMSHPQGKNSEKKKNLLTREVIFLGFVFWPLSIIPVTLTPKHPLPPPLLPLEYLLT